MTPTLFPTKDPTRLPTLALPTISPETRTPTLQPSLAPSVAPTGAPTTATAGASGFWRYSVLTYQSIPGTSYATFTLDGVLDARKARFYRAVGTHVRPCSSSCDCAQQKHCADRRFGADI